MRSRRPSVPSGPAVGSVHGGTHHRQYRPFQGKLISVRVDEVDLANGHTATREVVEHPGAVGILAWDGCAWRW